MMVLSLLTIIENKRIIYLPISALLKFKLFNNDNFKPFYENFYFSLTKFCCQLQI